MAEKGVKEAQVAGCVLIDVKSVSAGLEESQAASLSSAAEGVGAEKIPPHLR